MTKWISDKKSVKFLIKMFSILPKTFVERVLARYRYTEGSKGLTIRYACYTKLCSEIGKNVKISPGVYILFPEKLKIGDNVTIHEFSLIECLGEVEIGSNTSIAHKFSLLSSTHKFDLPGKSFRECGIESKKVSIGSDVWIGAGVILLYGTRIEDHCIIGAGSVVNKSFSPGNIIAGVPAKLIKKRNI